MNLLYDPIFNALRDWFMGELTKSAVQMLQMLMTFWLDIPTLPLSDRPGGTLTFLRERTGWLTAFTALIGLLVAAGRVAIQRKGEPFRAAFQDLVNLVVIVFALAAGVNLLNSAGDAYSTWILKSAEPGEGNWAIALSRGFRLLGTASNQQGIEWMILGGLMLTSLISSMIQFALMMFRNAIIVVLVGVAPLLAAARFTSHGNQAYKKALAWTFAFSFYKPIAATIYAGAFHMLRSESFVDSMMALFLISGAVFALPATMRVFVPWITEVNSVGHSVAGNARTAGHLVVGSTAANVHGFKPEVISRFFKWTQKGK
ncbi:hypothetical protein GCM10010191_44800 [Actinomadura vinacea]|uniref:Type IV secretion system protein n=1 Tax=Actinomadura vinacea TaxID=115336 RepID=A0ABN3JF27_9ACTN